MEEFRLLAVAINRKRMGYVFLVGGQLKDWQTMTKATTSAPEAAAALQSLINKFKPDVIVTEQFHPRRRNPSKATALKGALVRTAAQNRILDISVSRAHEYANKYEEAEALSQFFPEISPWLPRHRRIFDHEPATLVLFDALALAFKVMQRPSEQSASALG